jgi:hypothetical protein
VGDRRNSNLATNTVPADFYSEMQFDRGQIKSAIALLAAKGIYVGTSSWKN